MGFYRSPHSITKDVQAAPNFHSYIATFVGWIGNTHDKQHYEVITPEFETGGESRFSEYVESLGKLEDWSKNKQGAQFQVEPETVADKISPLLSLQVWSRFSRILGASRGIGGSRHGV